MKHTLTKFIIGFILLAFIFNSCFKDELKKEIDDLRGQLTSMQKKNDSLNSVLNVRADSLSKALSAAQKRSDSLSNILKTKSDSLSNVLGITNANLTALSKSVDSIKTQITSINGQLTQLNSQLASLTTQLNLLNQQLAALGGDVSQLASQYQALNASLQNINAQIAVLQAEQLKLLEQLNAILLQLNPPVDITTGLVAYYPFNGNAGDSSGNGNHGTVNGVILSTDRYNKANSSYFFNGIDAFVSIAPTDELNLLGDFTIGMWVNLSSLFQLGQTYFLLSKNNGITGTGPWTFQIDRFGDNFLPHYTADPCFCNDNIASQSPQFNLNNVRRWYYVTVSYSKQSNEQKLYIDGNVFSRTSNFQYNNQSTLTPMYIGRNSCSACIQGFFKGNLDDIRIYNRVLNQEQITYLATH